MKVPHEHTVVRLLQRPVGPIQPGRDLVAIREETPVAADLKPNQVLLKRLYLSLDPAMRGWMRDIPSYIPPVALGAEMRGSTVNEVVASTSPKFAIGDIVQDGSLNGGWSEYGIADASKCGQLPDVPGLPLSAHLGVLGITGLTAYFGLLRVGLPKAGETVLVSGAAGATGSVVCQVAKIKGCKVIGIAGGSSKCQWLSKELGLDGVVDYKAAGGDPKKFQALLRAALKSVGTRGVDVFFDNVGGMILNETLRRLNQHGRVVVCGAIASYNVDDPRDDVVAPTNYMALISLRARMEGFIVFDYQSEYNVARRELSGWIADGRMQFKEDVRVGLQGAPDAILSLFNGGNTGKLVVKVGDRSGSVSKM
eukprot:m.415196 g.415196  ORF g.415196 m.415196 type:complete len:366 (+) comp29558_c0_seq1:177-1274(+)